MKTKIEGWQYLAGSEELLDPFDIRSISGLLNSKNDAIQQALKDLNNNACKTVKGLVKLTIEFVPIKEGDLK